MNTVDATVSRSGEANSAYVCGFCFFYIKNEVNTGVANDINEGFV